MRNRFLVAVVTVAVAAGCEAWLPSSGEPAPAPEWADPAAEAYVEPDIDVEALARPSRTESVCRAFARSVAESALAHPADAEAFLAALQQEFIGGTDDPFEMKAGLFEGRWNPRYFYAGHGGFRPEYDDAQNYPDGGNHQPGHFVSVLSVAARFGEEQARIAIGVAGDYEPGQEDDLRLSLVAIPLGVGLAEGSVRPAEVARAARRLCRS